MFRRLLLALVLLSSVGSFAQTLKASRAGKLEPSLTRLHAEYVGHLRSGSRGPFAAKERFVPVVDEHVALDATAVADVEGLKKDLLALGMSDAVAAGRVVSGHLPVWNIPALARLGTLRFARPALAVTSAGSVTSQGDVAARSAVARSGSGVNGAGVKVGILSDSFNCLGSAASDMASGDLPSVAVLQEAPGCASATDEGRALLQVVHDVAPGASLLFATGFGGQAKFAANIVALKNAGARVIADDVFYLAEPMFQDGIIAQAVDSVVREGVAYFAAAGNWSRNAYASAFRPGPVFAPGAFPSAAGGPFFFGGTAHNFNASGGTDVFQRVRLPAGGVLLMSFQWDSPAFSVSGDPGSPNDLDVYIFNADGTQVVGGSTVANVVDSGGNGDPIEIVVFFNTTGAAADFNIMITNFEGPAPGLMKYVLFLFEGSIEEFATHSGTIYGHANARGAVAVGAAAYFETPEFGISPPLREPFSSSGATPVLFDTDGNRLVSPDPRTIKPEIVAPDGGDNTFFGSDTDGNGFPNFFGTSAAVAHAAGVAALLLAAKPSLTPLQLYASLENTAVDMDAVGFDNDSGFGLVRADAALGISLEGLSNISTRGLVQTADNVMIGGFIIEGPVEKTVLIRARGPSMGGAPFFVPGTLQNPFLRLFSGQTVIAQNDDWLTADPLCASAGFLCGAWADIAALGLDPCEPNPGQGGSPSGCDREAAILIRLPPGPYTAIVSGAGGGTGVGLVEVFEADGGASPSKLINISTRGPVQTGDNVMIGGFIIGGSTPKTVLIRGRGPSMGGAPFFVPGTLQNPFLRLFSGQTPIAENDDWQSSLPLCALAGYVCGGAQEISATGLDPCQPNPGQSTSPPGCAQEAAIYITLAPGPYTVHLSGVGGATGVGLVEVFEVN